MADLTVSPAFLGILVVSAFALPLVFLVWIRNTERYGREPWRTLLKTFLWGAVFSVLVAIVASVILLAFLQDIAPFYVFLAQRFADPETIFAVLIVAPFVEEGAKAMGARAGRRRTDVVVDGLVYGAAAGLGFSATENLFYGLAALADPTVGASGSLLLIAIRSFSSSLLHASSTAVTGFGLAKGWLSHRTWAFLPFYLVAVVMHGSFNFLASFGELYEPQYGEMAYLLGFAGAAVFAVIAVTVVRLKLASGRPQGQA